MTTNPLPGYDDWKTTPPDFFDEEPDDSADTLEMERLEQHENRLILLAKALAYTIRGVEQAQDPDVHLSLRAAALTFRLTDFERQVVLRAYDLACHHAGQADRKQLVEQAWDEIEKEDAYE